MGVEEWSQIDHTNTLLLMHERGGRKHDDGVIVARLVCQRAVASLAMAAGLPGIHLVRWHDDDEP